MRAVILAAGRGSRIFPYDRYWQKACLPVANEPNIRILAKNLNALGLSDITVVTGYLEECVRSALAGIDVRYRQAGERPWQTIAELCEGEDTLVVYGDVFLHPDDLAGMVSSGGCAALLESDGAGFQKRDWICASASGGKVTAFWGHPRETYGNARSAGVFRIPRESAHLLAEGPAHFANVPTGGMPPVGFTVEQCLQAAIGRNLSVGARFAAHPVVDIDYPWNLLEANRLRCEELCAGITETEADPSVRPENVRLGRASVIGPGVIFEGPCIVGDGTVIRNGAIIGANTVIGPGCVIENCCRIAAGTSVGAGCKIGFTAEVSGVLMESVSAVHGCELYGVIGQRADIGAGTTVGFLRFDDADAPQRIGGRTFRGPDTRAVFLGDHMRTGVNTTFSPGVKVGANCAVGPACLVERDVPHGKLVRLRQHRTTEDFGPRRYGWGGETFADDTAPDETAGEPVKFFEQSDCTAAQTERAKVLEALQSLEIPLPVIEAMERSAMSENIPLAVFVRSVLQKGLDGLS